MAVRSDLQPLTDYLAACAEPEIILTFDEIDGIVDARLPASARLRSYYWIDRGLRAVRDWQALGWYAKLDVAHGCVRFSRSDHRRPDPPRARYQPLVDHLAARDEREVVLTFAEIEAIIGGQLPTTAYTSGAYWSGQQFAHTRALRALGWSGRIDRTAGAVRFTREGSDAR